MPKVLRPQAGPQEKFLATSADICIFGGSAGGGKAMPLDEPVLTPFGFRPMGEIKVGERVTTANGHSAAVIQVHPQGVVPIYRITFIDGAETRCTGEHLWLAREARKHGKLKEREGWKIYDTFQLIEEVKKGKNMLIPLCKPVVITKGRTCGKIKPYTLGAILGDGCTSQWGVTICGEDEEVFNNIRAEGYELKEYYSGEDRTKTYGFQNFREEKRWLTAQGLKCKAESKFIPNGYKLASIEDRKAILQGLLDTDGHADKRGHIQFSTISERLAKDVQEIVWSLGGKATITTKTPVCVFPDGTKKECKTAYMVYIQTENNADLFRLKRKKERCEGKKFNGGYSPLCRRITAIEPCGEAECQCITIDEPNGLYVAKDFIVTHNSYGLLLSPLRYKNVPGFGAVIFRKNAVQIYAEGGLWDQAAELYGGFKGAQVRKGQAQWQFSDPKTGEVLSKVSFAHIERNEDTKSWQGTQICEICFDELTHFSEYSFFYMLSRNRSTCGVKPFIRATCNPDADSWVAKFIAWWIDQETGYPIKERGGKLRWMIRRNGEIYWADDPEELCKKFNLNTPEERAEPKSVTFIPSTIYDNAELLRVNPEYLANLKALPIVEKERLLYGNWKIKPAAGLYFKREQLGSILQVVPSDVTSWVRGWDLAASTEKEGEPAYTAGVLIGKRRNGRYVVADVINVRLDADGVRNTIRLAAESDRARYGAVRVRIPQDPGQAGKAQVASYIKWLAGFEVIARLETGSKETRAEPVAAQWQGGNFDIVSAPWNDAYLSQLESFPASKFKDMVDATSSAFNEIEYVFDIRNLI